MERQFIPKSQLIHGAYYAGTCRNASIARWNAIEQRFYHWRHKFGFKFVETIQAPEDDDKYDVFYATSVIGKERHGCADGIGLLPASHAARQW